MDNNIEDLRNFYWWLSAVNPTATCEINRVREIEPLRKRRQYILSIIPKPPMETTRGYIAKSPRNSTSSNLPRIDEDLTFPDRY